MIAEKSGAGPIPPRFDNFWENDAYRSVVKEEGRMLQGYKQENFLVSFPSPHVLHLEINRPQKLNAFNDALWSSLRTLFDTASTDPEVRAIVLSGRGRGFTAGLDITSTGIQSPRSESSTVDAARRSQSLRLHILDFQDSISSLQRCMKPIVCCLSGIAFGLAIDIASAADIRYASTDTQFCIKEVDIGLAADVGSLQRLPKVMGHVSWVKEMAMTAATFSAGDALRHGLVSRVLESREACIQAGLDTARRIAAKSPVAVQGTKFLLDYSREHTVQEGLLMTAVWNASMLQANDVGDAIAATLMRKSAKFSKL